MNCSLLFNVWFLSVPLRVPSAEQTLKKQLMKKWDEWDAAAKQIREIQNSFLYRMRKRFPGGASGKEPTCQCRRQKRCRLGPWVGKIPWRRAWQPTPVLSPGESHVQRSLAGYSPWGRKESAMTERLGTAQRMFQYPDLWGFYWGKHRLCIIHQCMRITYLPQPALGQPLGIKHINISSGDFPGGPGAKTSRSQCKEPRFDPFRKLDPTYNN